MNPAVDHYLAVHRESVLPGRGLTWLDALRDAGIHRFKHVGFPTMRDEDWRHTNVRPIQKQVFKPVGAAGMELDAKTVTRSVLGGLDAYRFVFVNGRYSETLSDFEGLPSGVTAKSLAATVTVDSNGLRQLLGSVMPQHGSGFVALNTAFIEDGLYLKVDEDCEVDKPIELLFINDESSGHLIQPRNLFILGRRCRTKIIEHYVSSGSGSYFTNAVTELFARDSAVVEHTKIQDEGSKAFHIGGVFMYLQSGAHVVSNNIALGSLVGRTDLEVTLAAEGGQCDLNGVYLANGRQHIDNFTQVNHQQPNCRSDEFYKGVLDERARAVFRGRVVVHQDAQQTDAQQQNRNLLLSQDAEIDTKPQLEIYADDVKCSHGATVGQLDAAAMFYLRSRAIDETTARSLLTYAFAADIINRLSLQPVREHVENVLSMKLFGGSRLEELV